MNRTSVEAASTTPSASSMRNRRERSALPATQFPGGQARQNRQHILGFPDLAHRAQVHDESNVSGHATTGFIQIHIDTGEVRTVASVEEQVGAAGGLTLPSSFELVAGRLLKAREFPPHPRNRLPERVDQRLERQERLIHRRRVDAEARVSAHPPDVAIGTFASGRVTFMNTTFRPPGR